MTTKIPAELSSTPGISDSSNATAITIDSSENIGIGTTPATGVRLDIRNDSTTNIVDLRNANSSGFGLYTAGGSSSSQYAFRAADKDNNALFSVMSDGNVGVGTTSPSYMLTVKSSSNNHFRMENGSELGVLFLDSNGDISLWAHGDENIKFLNGTGSGTVRAQIHPDGEFSIPNQPCLTATKGSDTANVGHGATQTLSFTNEYFDIGSNFDGTYFTAPEDGMYLVAVSIRCEQVEANLPYAQVYLTASNNAYYIDLKSFDDFLDQQANFFRMNGSVVVHLDAGDTCYVRFYADNLPSGSNTLDIDAASQLSIIKVS